MRRVKLFLVTIFCLLSLNFFAVIAPVQAHPIQSHLTVSQSYYFMGFFDRFKAKSKKLEGEAQEAKGKLTNDKAEELTGKAKQAQGTMMEATEDVKEALQQTSENISNAVKDLGDKSK